MELLDEPAAREHHAGTHDDGTQHPVEQHPTLQLGRNGEVAKQHQPDEDVVHRQRLLDEVAGEELQPLLVGDLTPGTVIQPEPDGQVEQQGHADPDEGPDPRLFQRHLVRLAAADKADVNPQQDQHYAEETGPHPPFTHFSLLPKRQNPRPRGVGLRLEQIHLASRQGLTYS
ncbi:hypothetical protein D3C85_1072860 [compost metagenome]